MLNFWNFSIISLPTYDAILGKPWLDRWNPVIDLQKEFFAVEGRY